jgi:hypothetical protein
MEDKRRASEAEKRLERRKNERKRNREEVEKLSAKKILVVDSNMEKGPIYVDEPGVRSERPHNPSPQTGDTLPTIIVE